MKQNVEGIILREVNYGETSKVLTILTKEYGLIGVISKGCRSMKSKNRSISANLTYANFNIYYKKDKLSILNEAFVLNSFINLKKDVIKISYAGFLLELANQVAKQSKEEKIYETLISALIKIEEGLDASLITSIVEIKYLEFLGIKPILDECSSCFSKENIVTLSAESGGYLCSKCIKSEKIVDKKTVKLLRMLFYVDLKSITKLNISKKVKLEISEFISEYYERNSGLYLKTREFLNSVSKL